MKLKLTESEVSQEIDLEKVLGAASDIPAVTEAFSQALLDHIRERTESGRDVNGKIFPSAKKSDGYSESYKDSLAFKVYGKTNKINMRLTGDMLDTMFADQSNGKLKLTFDGPENNIKAYAHMSGFEGHPTIKGAKPREVFGIPDKELEKIAKEYKPNLNKEAQKNDKIILNKLMKVFGF